MRKYKVSITGNFTVEANSPQKVRDLISAFIKAKEFNDKDFECGISLVKTENTVQSEIKVKDAISVKEVIKESKKRARKASKTSKMKANKTNKASKVKAKAK